jgi:hypothetical protein
MRKIFFTWILSSACFFPQWIYGCAVCFNGQSPDMVKGFTWGIVLLLALPFVLISGLVGLVIYHMKKNHSASFPQSHA